MKLTLPSIPRFRWVHIRQRMLEWLSILLLVAVVVIPVAMLAWLAFFTDTFVIQSITIVDARPHTEEAVRGLMAPALNQNIFFTQTAVLEKRLLNEIPQIRTIHIIRKLPGTLKVIVQEKTPALLLLSNTRYYFVDQRGIAYEEARLETLPGIVLPTVKNNDSNSSVTLGVPVVAESFIEFITAAQEELPNVTGSQVAEIRIPSLAAREVHFHMDNNWILKLDNTRPFASQLDVLDRLLEHTISAEQLEKIEYIDLRIPNRVYYKLRP